MPPGQTPYTVVVIAHANLVDKVQPGDRVTVTGIYRAAPLKVNIGINDLLISLTPYTLYLYQLFYNSFALIFLLSMSHTLYESYSI